MYTMQWLGNSEHQGIIILIAILQFVFAVARYQGPDIPQLPGMLARGTRVIVLLVVGWIIYGIPWALLAFSMRFPPSMVFNPLFFVLGAFTVIGAITARAPIVGGFIGGSVPLATLSLFFLSVNPRMQATAPPLAWFGLCMTFGGLLGALTGPATLGIVRAVKLRAPVWRPRGKGKPPQDDRPSLLFDAFLSHNSKDKTTVRQLARALEARGLRVWLDEEQLVPGRSWQKGLEKVIQTTRAAVVLVGENGLGPWEIPEMQACLSQFVKRDMPVIPVLLPDASEQPELPLFLQTLTWVDLRGGLTEDRLNRLEWGITGIKPGPSAES